MTLHEQIKQARIKAGMTQKQLAEKSGTTQQHVQQAETVGKCSIEFLQSVANSLETNLIIFSKKS